MNALEVMLFSSSLGGLGERPLRDTPDAIARFTYRLSNAPAVCIRVQASGELILKTLIIPGQTPTDVSQADLQLLTAGNSPDPKPLQDLPEPDVFNWKTLRFLSDADLAKQRLESQRAKRRRAAKENRIRRRWSSRLSRIPVEWFGKATEEQEFAEDRWELLQFVTHAKPADAAIQRIRSVYGAERLSSPPEIHQLDGDSVIFEFAEENQFFKIHGGYREGGNERYAGLYHLFRELRDHYFGAHLPELRGAHSDLRRMTARELHDALRDQPVECWSMLYAQTPVPALMEAVKMLSAEMQAEIQTCAENRTEYFPETHREIERHIWSHRDARRQP